MLGPDGLSALPQYLNIWCLGTCSSPCDADHRRGPHHMDHIVVERVGAGFLTTVHVFEDTASPPIRSDTASSSK